MERIGFFGGCFNPPTNIHIKIANDLIKNGKLDKVVFVPVNDYYEKESLAPAFDRYKMLKLAIQEYSNLDVDDIEIKENKKLFAADIFEIIENSMYINKYTKENRFFIMGSDNYNKMPNWKDYNKIKDKYNYIVIDREENQISSTEIRKMIKLDDKNVKKYLPKKVHEYIVMNELYKED